MPRFVTFRFDDGFLGGAQKAHEYLTPNGATFFIISALVTGADRLECHPLFKEREFGTIEDWRELSRKGHDIQLHGATHADMSMLSMSEQEREVRESLNFIRTIHSGPYIFCFPYNHLSAINLSQFGISAAGFVSSNSDNHAFYNLIRPSDIDVYKLKGWTIYERQFDKVAASLRAVPDWSWTILSLHSFDGEGWEPWSTEGFKSLVSFVTSNGFEIFHMRGMLSLLTEMRKESL